MKKICVICFRYNTPYSLVSEHSFYTPEGWLSYNLLLHKITLILTIITSHNYSPFTPQAVLNVGNRHLCTICDVISRLSKTILMHNLYRMKNEAGCGKKKHVKSNGPFERNFCVTTSSAFSQEHFTSLERKHRGKKGIREKKRARKKLRGKSEALFPLRMKGNVTTFFQSISG